MCFVPVTPIHDLPDIFQSYFLYPSFRIQAFREGSWGNFGHKMERDHTFLGIFERITFVQNCEFLVDLSRTKFGRLMRGSPDTNYCQHHNPDCALNSLSFKDVSHTSNFQTFNHRCKELTETDFIILSSIHTSDTRLYNIGTSYAPFMVKYNCGMTDFWKIPISFGEHLDKTWQYKCLVFRIGVSFVVLFQVQEEFQRIKSRVKV